MKISAQQKTMISRFSFKSIGSLHVYTVSVTERGWYYSEFGNIIIFCTQPSCCIFNHILVVDCLDQHIDLSFQFLIISYKHIVAVTLGWFWHELFWKSSFWSITCRNFNYFFFAETSNFFGGWGWGLVFFMSRENWKHCNIISLVEY